MLDHGHGLLPYVPSRHGPVDLFFLFPDAVDPCAQVFIALGVEGVDSVADGGKSRLLVADVEGTGSKRLRLSVATGEQPGKPAVKQ